MFTVRAKAEVEDKLEKERVAMAVIDWHDFVVVETIEFDEDEEEGLPEPMTAQDVISAAKKEFYHQDKVSRRHPPP
jgi:splicing factor 3A subunit 1